MDLFFFDLVRVFPKKEQIVRLNRCIEQMTDEYSKEQGTMVWYI